MPQPEAHATERTFAALWCRFRESGHPDNADQVRSLAEAVGLVGCDVSRRNIGDCVRLDAWLVRTERETFALPLKRMAHVLIDMGEDRAAKFWAGIEWFHPAYMIGKDIDTLFRSLEGVALADKEATLARELRSLYPPAHLATMLLHRYPELPEFSDYLPLIHEAAECFYLRRERAAVAALVPVVEGLLLKFLGKLQGRDDLTVTGAELLRQVIDQECARAARRLVFHGMRVPDEYYERRFLEQASEYVHLLSTFEAFGVSNLFAPTRSFAAVHNLNRHGILHGKWTNFGRPENFHRLWSILDMIAFALSMGTSGVSGLMPAMSPEALLLASELGMMGQLVPAGTNLNVGPGRGDEVSKRDDQ